MTAAVLGSAAGAGLVLLGASRVWSTETVPQPPPLSAQEIVHTGSSLAPALPALALVALAGAGGLLATRGRSRRMVGALVVLSALGAIGLVFGQLGAAASLAWPVACLLGALVTAAAGVLAARDGASWPVMGARYARSRPTPAAADASTVDSTGLWDALERGEDPTR